MNLFLKWFVSALSIIITAYLLPGVFIAGLWSALWLALFLGFINAVIRPILILLTLPINILTLGLFTFVINALLIMLASSVIQGFDVDGFIQALFFSLVLSIVNSILGLFLKD